MTFQVPLQFILAHGVDHRLFKRIFMYRLTIIFVTFFRFQYKVLKPDRKKSICTRIGLHLPFFLVFCIQVVMAYLFWLAYGTLAFILGPLRTWSLILAAILWYNAIYLPEKCIRFGRFINILYFKCILEYFHREAADVLHLKPALEECDSNVNVMKQ